MSRNFIKVIACLSVLFVCHSVFAQEAAKDPKSAAAVKTKDEAAKPAAVKSAAPVRAKLAAEKAAAEKAAAIAKEKAVAKTTEAAQGAVEKPSAKPTAAPAKPATVEVKTPAKPAAPAAAKPVKPATKVDDKQKYTGFWIHTLQCIEKGEATYLLKGAIDGKGALAFDCLLQGTDYLPRYRGSKVMKDQIEIEFDILGCEEKTPCTAKYSLLFHDGKLLGQLFVTGQEPQKVILSHLEKDQLDEMIVLVGKDAQDARQKAIEAADLAKKKIAELTAALNVCNEKSAKLTQDLAAVKEKSAADQKTLVANIETLNANLAKITAEKESIAAQLGKTVTEKQALADKLAADAARAVEEKAALVKKHAAEIAQASQEKAALTKQAADVQAAAAKTAADNKAVTDQLTAQVNAAVAENNKLKASVDALTKEKAAAAQQVAAAQKQAQQANFDMENVKQYYTFLKKRNEQQKQRIDELEAELEFYTQQIQKLRQKLSDDKSETRRKQKQ